MRPPRNLRITAATAAIALGLPLVAGLPAAATSTEPADGVTDGLRAWYPLDDEEGAVARDAIDNGYDGTLVGGSGWAADGSLELDGSGWVDLPDDMLAGTTAVTITADVWIDPALSGNYFFYTFGNEAVGSPQSGTGYLFSSSANNRYRGTVSGAAWSNEQNTISDDGALAAGRWTSIAYSVDGSQGRLYADGELVGSSDAITHVPGEIGGGSTTRNAIGLSAYAADKAFTGRMRDVRLYERALDAGEVASIDATGAAAALAGDSVSLGDVSAVNSDLELPAVSDGGAAVTWSSSDPDVITDDGQVAAVEEATDVTLTATLELRGHDASREVVVTVVPLTGDAGRAEAAATALDVVNADDARGNLTLPTTGDHGATVSWTSADESVVTATGEVNRPAAGDDAVDVTLTATVTVGAATATRDVVVHVPPLPAAESYEGYLFSYFIGEGTASGEQVYFGLSEGNDPLRYRDLNDNQPVLTSELGDKGLRDPFIIRSPEGDKFYQIATDLKVHGSWNWDAIQRHGSKSIMVWESTDLVNWTDQRLVQVAPENAGNTWAPEAYYDESIGEYVVFWASKLYADNDPNHTGNTYNRMMYATTRDFVTFSDPQVWVDPGYSVIDSTVMLHDGEYYRFTKDERNNTSSTPCSKFITGEKSSDLRSTDYEFITDCIGKANSLGAGINQGEGPTIFKSNTEEKWYMFIDEFGGRGYVPFETTDLDAAEWKMSTGYKMPSHPRHGTVLPVTQAEYDRLLQTYQPDAFVESVEDVAVTVQVDQEPVLPTKVAVQYADGSTGNAAVTWAEIDSAQYAEVGTFEVTGTVTGSTATARAVVTVQSEPIPVEEVRVEPASVQLWHGGERQLTAQVRPATASQRDVTWSSADESVATITADGLLQAVAAGSTIVTASAGDVSTDVPVTVTEQVPGLMVHYPLDETSGTQAANAAPDSTFGPATLVGGATPSADGVKLDGTNGHVRLPNHLLAGLSDITVTLDVRVDPNQATPYFIYGMGNTSGSSGNGYLFTTGNSTYRSSITLGNWNGEQTVNSGSALPRGVWKHLTYTLSGTTAVLYLDGVEVQRQTGVTIDPGDIGGGQTIANYIGRSLYSGDRYLNGDVRDFRIYDRALDASEVAAIGADHTVVRGAQAEGLKIDAIVNEASSTVTLPMEPGTDLTELAVELEVSGQATVAPDNGSVQDLNEPVTYTVTGPGGSSREWTVRAIEMRSPLLPGLYADPDIAQFGDRFYIYATTDGFPSWGGKEFYVWHSDNLVDWERTSEPILRLDGDDGNVPWATGNAWAPGVIERDGKYYIYFSGHNPSVNRKTIGVAVADDPLGPFTAQSQAMILNNESVSSGQAIDPAAFRDPATGKHYLFWGNGGPSNGPVYAELADDMVSLVPGTTARISGLTGFREGLYVNHRDGLYHLTYSIDDTGSPNYRVGYATATSINGPWTYRGVILQRDDSLGVVGTGHSSILNVAGTDDWYIAYHRHAIPGGNGTNRETTIDRLEIGEDGLFKTVTPTLESITPVTVDPGTEVPVAVEVAPRCLLGSVQLAVRATNEGPETVDVELDTAFGTATVSDVAPGAHAYRGFTTRRGVIEAGTVTVTVSRGEGVLGSVVTEYDGIDCT
ncbi:family 43 glycosylhydrolase [Isoptericola croceus]|uniref:family 43 glycosylhydrolase n=1 Tax=Isoptericola croceus TaxID=3031406 RepID=UPI0023F9B8D7|nr:family 43 glycosylhydrolase [Isoptericola croceus]